MHSRLETGERNEFRERKREAMGTETMRNSCPLSDFNALPENCVANVLSLTSPLDSCRLSLVASTFRSAAESDSVWERFLPSDYQDMIARVSDSSSPLVFASKKELYLSLCDHPLIIDGGTKSFSLEKWSGKKCFMLHKIRFTELVMRGWLEIRGKISTQMLSPDTTYAAYLVFRRMTAVVYEFRHPPAVGWVRLCGSEGFRHQPALRTFYLHPKGSRVAVPGESNGQYLRKRGDGWLEMELGEHLNKSGEDGELEICLQDVRRNLSKLFVQGIEIRPKNSK